MIAVIESVINTLICVHTDDNHADTATFPTQHTHISKNVEEKKEVIFGRKQIAKLRPRQMTAASQGASHAVTRERQIQINYIPLI